MGADAPHRLPARSSLALIPVRIFLSPGLPAATPTSVDEHGRSAQTFLVDVVVRSGGTERRAVASGQDIYAVTAPLAITPDHNRLDE
jgi:hypothetical protein